MLNFKKTMLVGLAMLLLFFQSQCLIAADNNTSKSALQAVGFNAGWISGNGITYRCYSGQRFLQGTFFGVVRNNGEDAYVNIAFSAGTYLHKVDADGILPPMGLKVMAGADVVMEKRRETEAGPVMPGSSSERTIKENNSYYGAGVGLDLGNPGRQGLSLWLAVNYVFAFSGITSPEFDWFGARPSAGILYSW